MEERILNNATELFFSRGIKSVTMDDISRHMGVSKKTIYQFYADKKELVEKVIYNLVSSHAAKIQSLRQQAENAIQEVALQTEAMAEIIQSLKPGLFFELQKYFPATWQLINLHRTDGIYSGISSNLERGLREGLYRPGIDISTIAHIRLVQHRSVFSLQEFPADRFDHRRIANQLTELYLYGIATEAGQRKISKYINLNNNK